MKTKSSVTMWQLVAAGLLLLGAGCQTVEKHSLTHRVWDNSNWRKFSEPAPNPNLALFEASTRADVLVQYDALSEKHSIVERRAYYLQPNEARIATGKKPKFARPSVADELKPIAVLPTPSAITYLPPGLPAYALVTKEGRGFTLYQPSEPTAAFDLPVYAEASGTPTRLALTPFTVTGDNCLESTPASITLERTSL